jgi:hypothetical protein
MNEQGTPGHEGRICGAAELSSLHLIQDRNNDVFFLRHDSGSLYNIKHCPHCGLRLIPHEEPLPVPEGCSIIHWYPQQITAEYTVKPGVTMWCLTGPADKIKPAWRRMFSRP